MYLTVVDQLQSFNSNWGSDLDLNEVQFWVSAKKSHIGLSIVYLLHI
jgi:hypothetical protein